MNTLTVALATSIALIALTQSSWGLKLEHDHFNAEPHFPEIDCVDFKKMLKNSGSGRCDVVFSEFNNPDKDERVCIEYRRKYDSHCEMMNDHCNKLRQSYNLIGMCSYNRNRKTHRKYPYMKCHKLSSERDLDIQYYCLKSESVPRSLCAAFMKTYNSMCEFLYDYCFNLQVKFNNNTDSSLHRMPVAKVLSPKAHREMFKHHKYYDKCGMFSPIAGHSKKHFEDIFPNIKLSREVDRESFEANVRRTMFKFDHVCENHGEKEFKLENATLKSQNSFTVRDAHTLNFETKADIQDATLKKDIPDNGCKNVTTETS